MLPTDNDAINPKTTFLLPVYVIKRPICINIPLSRSECLLVDLIRKIFGTSLRVMAASGFSPRGIKIIYISQKVKGNQYIIKIHRIKKNY